MGTIGPDRRVELNLASKATPPRGGETTMTTTQDEPVAELSTAECWQLLELEQFGRLAYRLVDEVHLVPINYAADAGALLFRTASGNKLLAAALHSDVAFEIDWHSDEAAWSVVVRGRLHRLAEDE